MARDEIASSRSISICHAQDRIGAGCASVAWSMTLVLLMQLRLNGFLNLVT